MTLKFLNLNVENNTVRPTGYKFPVGLTVVPSANGGGTGTAVTFNSTPGPGTYTIPTSIFNQIDVLVIAGGGGGGGDAHGAGGAGGLVYGSGHPITPGETVTVTVGAGGGGAAYSPGGFSFAGNGTNSVFKAITAVGGGGGASYNGGSPGFQNGQDGGSGGGASRSSPSTSGGSSTQSPSGGLTLAICTTSN